MHTLEEMNFVFAFDRQVPRKKFAVLLGNYNPKEEPNFAQKILTEEFRTELLQTHRARYFDVEQQDLSVHANDKVLCIVTAYRNMPRLFRLERPHPQLLLLVRGLLPESTATALLGSYVQRHPNHKKYFPKFVQEEAWSPSGLVELYTKYSLKMVQTLPYLQLFPETSH